MNTYPYLPPAAAGGLISLTILLFAFLFLKETRPSKLLHRFGEPLLAAKEEGSPSSSASSSPPLRRSSSFLEAAMSSHASRVSLIISDDSKSDCDSTSPFESK